MKSLPLSHSRFEAIDPETGELHDHAARVILTDGAVMAQATSPDNVSKRKSKRSTDLLQTEDPKPTRGNIKEFTRKSQKRLMMNLTAWQPRTELALATLTYPATFPKGKAAKKIFRKFIRQFNSAFPGLAGMWKLEYQVRGAVHYHLIIDGIDSEAMRIVIESELRRIWRQARGPAYRLDETKKRHERNDVQFARDSKRAKFYLAKEAGKRIQSSMSWSEVFDSFGHHGAFWGFFNKGLLRTDSKTYYFPNALGSYIKIAMQEKVFEMLQDSARIKKNKKGDWVFASNDMAVEKWRLQSWMVTTDAHLVLQGVWEGLDWDHLRRVYDWLDVPSMEEFLAPP